MLDRRDEIYSPMGCSAAVAVDAAPYNDAPAEDRRHVGRHRPVTLKPPRAADALHPKTCLKCGLVVPPCAGSHRNLTECVAALRNFIAMERWAAPIRTSRR